MKKVFLSMLTAVALFASCSQEDLVSQTGGESMVSFTLNTPELASRAAGDGAQATQLNYAVYDAEGSIVATISTKGTTDGAVRNVETINKNKEVKLPLLNGETYSILFWAESSTDKMVTVDWTKKTISTNETLTSNKESYDAFYAYVKPFVVTGNLEKKIDLYRPFAQLNIGTTQDDLKNAAEYYGSGSFTKSSIEVTVPTAMDLTTGKVSGEKAKTYAAAAFYSTTENLKTDYVYLSMNYLLVSSEKSLVDVKFSCTNDTKTIDKTFKNVPVQRNYRTNIYGNLFTSTTDWNVTIESDFNDSEYNPAEQLAAVFEEGGEVTLYTDVELTEPLVLAEGKTVTLNLNGNAITAPVVKGEKTTSYLFRVNGGTLTIKGEGDVKTQNAYYSIPVWVKAGTANIYSGNFYNDGDGCDLIYTSGTGTVNIYGGYFKATDKKGNEPGTANANTALNKQDGSTSDINVYGGTFYNFDPANNASEGPNTNFVAEGYTSVKVDDNYVVVKGTAVTTENLEEALSEGGDVTLVADVTTSVTAALAAGTTLDGANKTLFIGTEDLSEYYTAETLRLMTTSGNATIKNLTIDGNNADYYYSTTGKTYGIRGIYLTGAGTVEIDNVTIKNVTYCLNDDSSEKTLNVSNSTFEGWTSYNTKTTATFTNTSFKKGTYGTLRPYAKTTFVNCDFAEGFVVDVNHTQSGVEYQPEVKFVNCTYAGNALTKTSALFESGDKMEKVTIE